MPDCDATRGGDGVNFGLDLRNDDVRCWHIASFRYPAEFDRYRGIADSGKPAAQQVYEFTARLPTTATAAVWPVFPLPRDIIGARSPCVQPQVLPWSLRQALTNGDADMATAPAAFDAVGIVVDWIDACKQQRLGLLLAFYYERAPNPCSDG